ncbi:RNA-binding protein 44 [Latimeria chalumnae]|uniref:RNA-binding protein 44 n=1 Tax=Latimeria chalumnae TaxID=7897 RepID=UPI0006D9054B|nr:PREDICTED: RNA-binding protein 44 isoform X2 [Latimeria chalumnae]XP_014344730.1 PREDICTED: RNA-binding protein 44 isoform X2 [Latimeria chalumnae]XP_014344731.1 PREDICTED: RNA-binding protein 44 isoform X2 [Latimeria chalumnae]XP_014344732.1 PREDICTED: RNA-binding protein 44 isoform X2 [Latimeria chalumnae]XP_014344733.1 PREDICTED: RNA-binding protein 44 isoform X2 [Latimeria chalumnae]XP_014344734.1 PREDICTED: RNA-binding protein 44 isoform X2 [Latimeria chalumnae]|eukprot:XP_014344728.1 PREDICTED: RNA-binding protein 44 isoform X2 [Latimeria chalumnae]
MMLSTKDRAIIKAEGGLVRFLENCPQFDVINNFVFLKVLKRTPSGAVKDQTTGMSNLNKSRRPTFYCVWPCEDCGFNNTLDASVCTRCSKAMKQSEQTMYLKDENALHNSWQLLHSGDTTEKSKKKAGRQSASGESRIVPNAVNQGLNTKMKACTSSGFTDQLDVIYEKQANKILANSDLPAGRETTACYQDSEPVCGNDISEPKLPSEASEQVNLSLDVALEDYRRQNEVNCIHDESCKYKVLVSIQKSEVPEEPDCRAKNPEYDLEGCVDQETFPEYYSIDNTAVDEYTDFESANWSCSQGMQSAEMGIKEVLQNLGQNSENRTVNEQDPLNKMESPSSDFCSAETSALKGESFESLGAFVDSLGRIEDCMTSEQLSDFGIKNPSGEQFRNVAGYTSLVTDADSNKELVQDCSFKILQTSCLCKSQEAQLNLCAELITSTSLLEASESLENEARESEQTEDNSTSMTSAFTSLEQPGWTASLAESSALTISDLPDVFEASFVSAVDGSVVGRAAMKGEPQGHPGCINADLWCPGILANEDHLCYVQIPDTQASGDNTLNKGVSSVAQAKSWSCLNRVVLGSGIHQSIDASSDFRTSYTTSRGTSTRVTYVSRGSNTDSAMARRAWSDSCKSRMCRDMACNTDWSLLPGAVREEASQTVVLDMVEKCISTDMQTTDWNLLMKESQQFRKMKSESKDKKGSCKRATVQERSCSAASGKTEKKLQPAGCCRAAQQRAQRAEVQLLDMQFWMCYQYCWRLHNLSQEEEQLLTGPQMFAPGSRAKQGSTLLSVLQELKSTYKQMREEILTGTPIDSLPPLCVEPKEISDFTTYIPSKLVKRDADCGSRTTNEDRNEKAADTGVSSCASASSSLDAAVFGGVSSAHYPECCQPFIDGDVKEDHQENADGNRPDVEANEDWFDAEEDFTAFVKSVPVEGGHRKECRRCAVQKQDTPGTASRAATEVQKVKSAEVESAHKHCIYVGGLSATVTEKDIKCHFQKYQVTEVCVGDLPNKSRYAVVAVRTAACGKMAAEEMNGKEIRGKQVWVHVIRPTEGRGGGGGDLAGIQNSSCPEAEKELPEVTDRFAEVKSCRLKEEVVPDSSTGSSTPLPWKRTLMPRPKGSRRSYERIQSVQGTPNASAVFIPQNSVNLSSFSKLMRKLTERHPTASRENIVEALLEVRVKNNGFLSGLALNTIVEMTSSILKKSLPKGPTD